MTISGSTRMQATTVQMLALGFALLHFQENQNKFKYHFHQYIDDLQSLDYLKLAPFILAESSHYQKDGIVTYVSSDQLGICILTDTTERSPTFSLPSFEFTPSCHLSLSYLAIKGEENSNRAWTSLLGREPRCLDWKDLEFSISKRDLLKFDLSQNTIKRREKLKNHLKFEIDNKIDDLIFKFNDLEVIWKLKKTDLFFHHMALKLLLNTLSTLIMGILGRYEGNMMTFVRPSNLKLINRSVRYIQNLLKESGQDVSEAIILDVFMNTEFDENEPRVLKVLKKIQANLL